MLLVISSWISGNRNTRTDSKGLKFEPTDFSKNSGWKRRRIEAHLKADAKKISPITTIMTRSKQFLPRISEDLELLEKVLETYEGNRTEMRGEVQ